MTTYKIVAIAATITLMLACNHGTEKSSMAIADLKEEINDHSGNDEKEGENGFQQPGTVDKSKQKQPQQPGVNLPVAPPEWDKKIIKNASINLEVEDYNKYYLATREKIKSLGGYISQEEQNQSDYKVENQMVIKVPVDQFENALALLSSNAKKLNERKVTSEDVTTEVVDTRSRIEARKSVRQRYLDLLTQAKNMEEILNVQSEINRIQEEIEAASGRLEYLGHSSSFSTIHLTWYQVLDVNADKSAETKASFGAKIKSGFLAGWEVIGEFFVVLITLWPLFLASFLVYLFYKKIKTHKKVTS